VKYFIPEWDDRVDPNYDFINDNHSQKHKKNPVANGAYLWDVFGLSNVPIDGVLVSRMTIAQNKKKYEQAVQEGIHKVLRLPPDFEILGDCGAFGYVDKKLPLFDPIEILQYYHDLGFNYGVTVDHLVVAQFEKDREERIRITFQNGVKAYQEWLKKFKEDFQLVVAIQGWDVSDYLKMYRDYLDLGATYLAFGGLARSPTSFSLRLIDELIKEIKGSTRIPSYLHFFGLARVALFPQFQELEDLGVEVGFDSASYLRKAWLSTAAAQLNYLTLEKRGYTAIRIPFVNLKDRRRKNQTPLEGTYEKQLRYLEQECLNRLRQYDRGETHFESVISILSEFNKALGKGPKLIKFYERTLEDQPWKMCTCPICRKLGIDVVIFRGNNRNRRRGFHNTYVFYTILQNPELWQKALKKRLVEHFADLATQKKGERVLIITECTKEKQGYDASVKSTAKEMYKGRLFQTVRKYCEAMKFDYVIFSAKYGLLFPDDEIEGYEKMLKTKEDVRQIQPLVEEKLRPLLHKYDKIIVIAGKTYRDVLQSLMDERFFVIKSKGYGDLCRIIKKSTPSSLTLLEFA